MRAVLKAFHACIEFFFADFWSFFNDIFLHSSSLFLSYFLFPHFCPPLVPGTIVSIFSISNISKSSVFLFSTSVISKVLCCFF